MTAAAIFFIVQEWAGSPSGGPSGTLQGALRGPFGDDYVKPMPAAGLFRIYPLHGGGRTSGRPSGGACTGLLAFGSNRGPPGVSFVSYLLPPRIYSPSYYSDYGPRGRY